MPAEQQRREYLEALGIDVWVPRGQAPDAAMITDEPKIISDTLTPDWEELRTTVAA